MDAQALCDAATQGDIDGISLCLLGMELYEGKEHNEESTEPDYLGNTDVVGAAWFYALFSRSPEMPMSVRENRQDDVLLADELPHVQFANSHVIQEMPHISLRVLLLLPSWHVLPWCAIRATIEDIRQIRMVAHHALSCLSEIQRFLSGSSCDLIGRNNQCTRDAAFWKAQLLSLVQSAAGPLIFSENSRSNEFSHFAENQHLVFPLEIIPSLFSAARRIDSIVNSSPLERRNNTNEVIVDDEFRCNIEAELCDVLFDSGTSLSRKSSLFSTMIVPFLTLALDCASYLQRHHWYMVQKRILNCLHPSETSIHPLDYARLLRHCVGILAWFPEDSQVESSRPTSYCWEYVIIQLYYSTCSLSSSPGILATMDKVLFSTIGQLPFHSTVRMLRYIQHFISDLLPLSMKAKNLKESSFISPNDVDKDSMLWVCSNIALSCCKSHDVPRRTFHLAASALGIAKGCFIDSDEEVVHTLLNIMHVKSLLAKSELMLDDYHHEHQSCNLIASRTRTRSRYRNGISTQMIDCFVSDLSELAYSFSFLYGGKCFVESKKNDPSDKPCSIESFSEFLSACAEVVYQSIHSGRDFDLTTDCHSSLSHDVAERCAAWMLTAFSMLSGIPKQAQGDLMHRYLMAISIIACVFLEIPSSQDDIVRKITKTLTEDTSNDRMIPLVFCSLCSVIVKSVVNVHNTRVEIPSQYTSHDREELQLPLEPIFHLLTSSTVVMDHDVRNSLARALLFLPSARAHILSLGRKMLTAHKLRLHYGEKLSSNLTAALDILLGLVNVKGNAPGHQDPLTTEVLPLDVDEYGLEAMSILIDIILLEKYALQLSDRAWLFQRLTDLTLRRTLPQLVAIQILRASLRKLLRYFVVNETSSNQNRHHKSFDVPKSKALIFIPARCFTDYTSKVNGAGAVEDIPGLLQTSLFLIANYTEEKSDFHAEILSTLLQILTKKGSAISLNDLELEEQHTNNHPHNTIYNVAASVSKALLFTLFTGAKVELIETVKEPKDRLSECVLYETALAAECEFECKLINLSLKRRLPTSVDVRIVDLYLLKDSPETSKITEAMSTFLLPNCADVIIRFLLSQNKFPYNAQSPEILTAVNCLLKLHQRSSDTGDHSSIRVASALSFFNQIKCFDFIASHYSFAAKYYCDVIQSVFLKDTTMSVISVYNILMLVESIFCMYQTVDHSSWPPLLLTSKKISSLERSALKIDGINVEHCDADFGNTIICAFWHCLETLKKRLSVSNMSHAKSSNMSALLSFCRAAIGEEGGRKLSLFNVVRRLCVDAKSNIGAESPVFVLAKYQLKCIETALDLVALLLSARVLTCDETEEVDELCETLSTSLWSIACMRAIEKITLTRLTLRLLILRVPLFRASVRPVHAFFSAGYLDKSHFVIKAARQCFNRLKVWYQEERQGRWNEKVVGDKDVVHTGDLYFGTVEVWSWCLECVLSALEQKWAFLGKSIRSRFCDSTEADCNLCSQASLLNGALSTKNDLESMIIFLCDILGAVDNVEDPERSECNTLYAELLSPRSKVLLSTVLDRVAQTMESSIRHLHKRLDSKDSSAAFAVDSIVCLASLIDSSRVACSAKDLAARTRKWFYAERKRAARLKAETNLEFHVEDASVLNRLPKVLFRIEQYESRLQALLVDLRVADGKKLKSSLAYNALFQNIQSNKQVSKSRSKNTKSISILTQNLSRYVSISTKLDNFGMALILDNSCDDGNEVSEVTRSSLQGGDLLIGPATTNHVDRKKRRRAKSFREVWNRHQKSAPRSRNKAVDEWLQTDTDLGGDTFADLEDFLVPG